MKFIKSYLHSILPLFLVLLLVNPLSAAPIEAYGGYISDSQVFEGDKVIFSGTFFNKNNESVQVKTMNVTFVETLSNSSNREPNRPNISKSYDTTRQTVPINGSITDSLVSQIDFNPGVYRVSIFFTYTNGTTGTPAPVYALTNQTFLVEGATRAFEVIRTIGIVLAILAVVIIGVIIYNAKFRRRY